MLNSARECLAACRPLIMQFITCIDNNGMHWSNSCWLSSAKWKKLERMKFLLKQGMNSMNQWLKRASVVHGSLTTCAASKRRLRCHTERHPNDWTRHNCRSSPGALNLPRNALLTGPPSCDLSVGNLNGKWCLHELVPPTPVKPASGQLSELNPTMVDLNLDSTW